MDLYSSQTGFAAGSKPFQFPDFDGYTASSPFANTELRLVDLEYHNVFDQVQLRNHTAKHDLTTAANIPGEPDYLAELYTSTFSTDIYKYATRKPTLIAIGATPTKTAPPFSFTSLAEASNNGSGTLSGPLDFFPMPNDNDPTYVEPSFEATPSSFIHQSGTQVYYYTNLEIINHLNSVASIQNFIDWKAGTLTAREEMNEKSIGAIQVITPDGTTYHYSLPIQTTTDKEFTFDLSGDGMLPSTTSELPEATSWWVDKTSSSWSYASSWKLTAITGPSFQSNGDAILDNEDNGYWIAIDYALWSNSMEDRFPLWGYQSEPSTVLNRRNTSELDFALRNGVPYQTMGITAFSSSASYYPVSIRTASHSAIFFHSVRLDDYSISAQPLPSLKLEYVYLFDNSDVSQLNLAHSILPDPEPFNNSIYPSCSIENVYNTEHLISNTISSRSIAGVRLSFDYSLAQNYDRNYNAGFSGELFSSPMTWAAYQSSLFNETIGYHRPIGVTTLNYEQSGKLTLKAVQHLGYQGLAVTPPYDFDYYRSITTEEGTTTLDYDPGKVDYNGHYKVDRLPSHVAKYSSTTSSKYVHAWALKNINDPLGASIRINYECDRYEKVGGQTGPSSSLRRFVPFTVSSQQSSLIHATFADDGYQNVIDDYQSNSTVNKAYLHYSSVYPCTGFGIGASHRTVRSNVSLLNDNTVALSANGTDAYFDTEVIDTPGSGSQSCTSTLGKAHFLEMHYSQLYGGGLRVRQLLYENGGPGTSSSLMLGYSAGIMTAEADPIDRSGYVISDYTSTGEAIYSATQQRELIMDRASGDRHIPSSQVGYSLVTETIVDNEDNELGSNEYEFNNYNKPYYYKRYSYTRLPEIQDGIIQRYEVIHCVEENSLYGQPSRTRSLDKSMSSLIETKYNYEFAPSSEINQAFARFGTTPRSDNNLSADRNEVRSTVIKTSRIRGLASIEHFANGEVVRSSYPEKDPYTGAPLRIRKEYGDDKVEEVIHTPAYVENPEMGPRCLSSANTNQLAEFTREVRSNGTAEQMTWSSEHVVRTFDPLVAGYRNVESPGPWMPVKQYVRAGTTENDWKYLGRTTLLSSAHSVLEQKNMSDGYSASRLDLTEKFPIAEVSNSNYASFTFSSFENQTILGANATERIGFDGEFLAQPSSGCEVVDYSEGPPPHSGRLSLHVPTGQSAVYQTHPQSRTENGEIIQTGLLTGRTYRAVGWVHRTSPVDAKLRLSVSGSYTITVYMRKDDPSALVVGDWVRLDVRIAVPDDLVATDGQGLTLLLEGGTGGAAHFDDVLLYPVDAQVSAACWNMKRGTMTEAISPEGFVTRYTHDASGSVIKVEQETERGMHPVSEIEVGYAKPF
jgi:hypothetical protein